MSKIFLIEDDPVMAECIARAAQLPPKTVPPLPPKTVSPNRFPENPKPSESQPKPKTPEPHHEVKIFPDAISAISALENPLPDLILLDVLLSGPDGFAFLNELSSYQDTAKIPVILITSLDLTGRDLEHYGVVKILNKGTMTPQTIQTAIAHEVAYAH